jgi:type I restriction enzyme, S subunit
LSGEYLERLLRSQPIIEAINSSTFGAKMPRADWQFVGGMKIPIPPSLDQGAIVRFLNHVDVRIRRYIRAKQKLIKLIEEEKQAIIHRTLTGGLNPNVRLRPSGVEWLGQVPEHWSVQRTKFLFRLRTEKSGVAHGKELLSIYTHIGVRPRKELEEKGNKASTTDNYWVVRKGDIIVNKLLAWMGAVGASNYDGVTSPAYDILMPIRPLVPEFYHHLFRTYRYREQFKQRSRGIMDMRLRLYFDQLGQIPIPVPPLEEQAAIVAYYMAATADLQRTLRQRLARYPFCANTIPA